MPTTTEAATPPAPLADFSELTAANIGDRVEFVFRYGAPGRTITGTVSFVRPGSHVVLADAERRYPGALLPFPVRSLRVDWTLNWGWRVLSRPPF